MSKTPWRPLVTKPEDLNGYRLFVYQKVQGKYIEDVIKCGKERFRTEMESLSENKMEKFGEILLRYLEVESKIIDSQKADSDILSMEPWLSRKYHKYRVKKADDEDLFRNLQRAMIEMKQQFSQLKNILTEKEFDKSKSLRNILILLAYLMFFCLYIKDRMHWRLQLLVGQNWRYARQEWVLEFLVELETNSQSFPEETKSRFHSDCIQFETIIDSIPYNEIISRFEDCHDSEKRVKMTVSEKVEERDSSVELEEATVSEEMKKATITDSEILSEKDPFSENSKDEEKQKKEQEKIMERMMLIMQEISEARIPVIGTPWMPLVTKPEDLDGYRLIVYQKIQGKYIEDVIKCGKERFQTEMESLSENKNGDFGEILLRHLDVESRIIHYQKSTAEGKLYRKEDDSHWKNLREKIYKNQAIRSLSEMKQQFIQLKSILTEKEFGMSKSLRNILILLAYLMFSCENHYFDMKRYEDEILAITNHKWVLQLLFKLETNSQSFPEETKSRFHSDCIQFEKIIDSIR